MSAQSHAGIRNAHIDAQCCGGWGLVLFAHGGALWLLAIGTLSASLSLVHAVGNLQSPTEGGGIIFDAGFCLPRWVEALVIGPERGGLKA
eukprot:3260842-Amphidinium_carterae.1